MEKVVENSNRIQNVAAMESTSKKEIRPALYPKQKSVKLGTSLIFALVPLVISLLFSWFISAELNTKIKGLIWAETNFDYTDFSARIIDKINLISTTDVLMLSHLVSLNLNVDTSFFGLNVDTSGGILLLMAIPMITLLITGYLLGWKRPTTSASERLYSSFRIAIIYAIVFACISLFSGQTTDEPGMRGSIFLKTTYSFGNAWLHSFIISFIFISVGSLFSLPKAFKGLGSNQMYGISTTRAIMTTFSGMIICIAIVCGYLFTEKEFTDEDWSKSTKLAIATQIGGYTWNLSHLNSFQVKLGMEGEDMDSYGHLSYSFITGIKAISLYGYSSSGAVSSGEGWIGDKYNLDYQWTILFILLALILHVRSGMLLRKSSAGNTLYEVLAYGVAFGIVSVTLGYILKMSFETDLHEIVSIAIKFPAFQTFIMSMLIALIGASIGWILSSKLTKKRTSLIK
ncbi:hypothetical protein J2W91_004670 [Paenibacillus amylolyticus]|uniref:Uncharacterized protein n=1 Tax=Paenibacillus amylolyticus TaxID=1451 RepID=A0AAP5H964_PAEAM|nr:hypothetical protein [Paenibacillus amylolyticus]MDR6726164.1 hypothetical protein [Paenibacillus amylolyticus]